MLNPSLWWLRPKSFSYNQTLFSLEHKLSFNRVRAVTIFWQNKKEETCLKEKKLAINMFGQYHLARMTLRYLNLPAGQNGIFKARHGKTKQNKI